MDLSGLFSFKGIKERNILKLAPDAFAVMNNAFGNNVIAPMDSNTTTGKNVSMQGGITSMNVNATISPAGAGRASIEIIAPQYKGLHNDYYIDMPNGVRMPYFIPMTEVKIYMKARYIESNPLYKYKPQYYPVFWGFITTVNESYSGGVSTFSLNCADILNWWAFQKLTIRPSAENVVMGSPQMNKFPTIFQNLNPWETIYALFLDTFFAQDGQAADGSSLTSNSVYIALSQMGNSASIGNLSSSDLAATLGGMATRTTDYWSRRLNFEKFAGYKRPGTDVKNKVEQTANPKDWGSVEDKAALEMYGLTGGIELASIAESVMRNKNHSESGKNRTIKADLSLDFSILERVQPYGAFSLAGEGTESLQNTKLDIANKVCEDTHMEFFLDLNGSFVFKPPMYNLDVAFGEDKTYVIESEDTINYTFAENTDNIVNFLEVTGPFNYTNPEMSYKGLHIDFPSVRRYGLRHQILSMNYGNTPRTLQGVAIAEMARINAKTKTGTVSIPLRSEMRLGYPVYLRHIDAFYYVTGITHSFTFGSSATTELSLESKRERIFDDGEITKKPGTILKGYVSEMKQDVRDILRAGKKPTSDHTQEMRKGARTSGDLKSDNTAYIHNLAQKEFIKETQGIFAGNNSDSFTEIRKASATLNPDSAISQGKKQDGSTDADTTIEVSSNELIHITKNTVPYTDKNGYRHIGAFPYGANLRLDIRNGYNIVDMSNRASFEKYKNQKIISMAPKTDGTNNTGV